MKIEDFPMSDERLSIKKVREVIFRRRDGIFLLLLRP